LQGSVMRWTSPGYGAAAPFDGQDVFHQGNCAMSAAFIGLDLTKSVFQVHGVDVHGMNRAEFTGSWFG
jgi:hypothetical protein